MSEALKARGLETIYLSRVHEAVQHNLKRQPGFVQKTGKRPPTAAERLRHCFVFSAERDCVKRW
jgi:hypothetical protein